MSRSRWLAVATVALGLGAVAVLLGAGPQQLSAIGETVPAGKAPPKAADKDDAAEPKGAVRVEAPHTRVDVDKERGKVVVKAPHTDVSVDPDKKRVQVRAPFVDLDIKW